MRVLPFNAFSPSLAGGKVLKLITLAFGVFSSEAVPASADAHVVGSENKGIDYCGALQ